MGLMNITNKLSVSSARGMIVGFTPKLIEPQVPEGNFEFTIKVDGNDVFLDSPFYEDFTDEAGTVRQRVPIEQEAEAVIRANR